MNIFRSNLQLKYILVFIFNNTQFFAYYLNLVLLTQFEIVPRMQKFDKNISS